MAEWMQSLLAKSPARPRNQPSPDLKPPPQLVISAVVVGVASADHEGGHLGRHGSMISTLAAVPALRTSEANALDPSCFSRSPSPVCGYFCTTKVPQSSSASSPDSKSIMRLDAAPDCTLSPSTSTDQACCYTGKLTMRSTALTAPALPRPPHLHLCTYQRQLGMGPADF
ncbi:hypothetical protein HPB48_002293 [Haemaphysalis longicornis]|uniref:Uncharacterized protein n=1 Tax=Haemaphysalis longicornis TaxID=44386 RepID=A0A9J6FHB3_HAELO|nr:hypothetical protein HPB48_002293 [Haemaphysalis longicornis]